LYADITWGAGGGTSDLTLEIASKLMESGMEANMHLTCTNMPVEKITQALKGAKEAGIQNIVALRGDPPKGQEAWVAAEGGFSCALDLVKYIRKEYNDYFCIAVAGYPEGHPNVIKKVENVDSLTESEKLRVVKTDEGYFVCHDDDYKNELAYLKQKVDAGADFIITQMFFDSQVFIQFAKDCVAAGINVPIMPGIMVIQSYGGFKRMTTFCKSRVPPRFWEILDAVKDDELKVKEAGVQLGTEMSKDLLAAGFHGLHYYSLNLEKVTYGILKELGLYKELEGAHILD
jgi:methylenetetrahydrofolate reductase (NADPH)